MQTKVAAHFRLVGFGRVVAFKLDKKPTAKLLFRRTNGLAYSGPNKAKAFVQAH